MTSLTPISPISTPRSPRALGDERAHLAVDGVARRQDLVQRARRHRLADRELHEPVDRVRHVARRQHRLLRIDHPRERRQRHADADAILGQDLLRRHLERRRTRVDLLDLDRAAHRPERMPARRQALGQLAVDEQQARLVRLDHAVHDQRHARQVEPVEVPLGDAHVRAGVDAIDVDLGDRLPERPRRVRVDEVLGLAVERHDGDLARAGAARSRSSRRQPRDASWPAAAPCRPATSARTTLTTSAARRRPKSKRHEAARAEQTLEPAIAREERPLVILDDHRELEQHDTSPILQCISLQLHARLANGRSPAASPRRGHGPALQPRVQAVRSAASASFPEERTRRCRTVGPRRPKRYPRWRRAPRRLLTRPHLGRSLDVSWMSREAAGFPMCECSLLANALASIDVGFEPTTLRSKDLMLYPLS